MFTKIRSRVGAAPASLARVGQLPRGWGKMLVVGAALGLVWAPTRALAADLIVNNTTVILGGTHTYDKVELKNNAKIIVPPYDGTASTGGLVLRAGSISIDASSSITAKGSGYQAGLCLNGPGPAYAPEAGGRGGCGVYDSAGGGAHFGNGGRGTKDCSASGCTFLDDWEEDCVGAVNGAGNACVSTLDCRDYNALPTVAGQSFYHSIYSADFGAAGGDKGCRDGDGFAGSLNTGGNGGGRIVLVAVNAAQTGLLDVRGRITANGNRGCGIGNDSAGGGAGGTLLLIGDTVTIAPTAAVLAAGGRGGDTQPKCLPCTTNADCGGTGQTCTAGRCAPCNCTPCSTTAQCGAGQTCKTVAGRNVCADALNRCTPFDVADNEVECKGTQLTGTCDDCGGGGGGGIVNVLSRVATISPVARFDVSGAVGGICPICSGEAGGGAGELQIDGAYVGEICDGFDNDFDGLIDNNIPALLCNGTPTPACVGGVPQSCPANVPACVDPVTDTRPRFVVIVDTSGSMLNDVKGNPTFGDGSAEHRGVDTNSDADLVDGNNSRLFIAKSALNDVVAAFPHADYALARYHQDSSLNRSCQAASWFECQKLCCSYDDPRGNTSPSAPTPPGCNMSEIYSGAGYPASLNANISIGWPSLNDCINYAGSCGAPRRGADVLVGFDEPLDKTMMWLDGVESSFKDRSIPGDYCDYMSGGDCELRATGPTPLAGSLEAVQDYLAPIIACDGAVPCREYSVILLTDGAESCHGDPALAAAALKGMGVNTYVVGFSVLAQEKEQLDAIASAGNTGAALLASDESGLANALAGIVAGSMKFEVCNGLDDDCDGKIDEDFPDKGAACDDGNLGVCLGTGVRVCSPTGEGTVCQITSPGELPGPKEICNGLDDNCNGLIDEGGICLSCVPTQEVCNGRDDDCNGSIDDSPIDVGRACGLDVGECSPGLTTCVGGVLVCDGATDPSGEQCNGLDDDCNGIVDGMTRACYSGPNDTLGVGVCRAGSQPCTSPVDSGSPLWGTCLGEVKPSAEICNGLDDNCDGLIDEQVSDGAGHTTGDTCCRFGSKCGVGVCTAGAYACAGSQVACDGGFGPSIEVCDGLDNDCDGEVDNVVGRGSSCAMPGGCPGIWDCQDTGMVCIAAASGLEVCNGIDDDCDGSIDEEPEVTDNDDKVGVDCRVPTAPNDAPPCAAGKSVCRSGAVVCDGGVQPAPETCNGVDDDCNGSVDEDNPCPGDRVCTSGQCLNRCFGGEFPCAGGFACVGGVCVPPESSTTGGGGGATTSTTGGGGGAPATSTTGQGGANASSSGAGEGGSSTVTSGTATGAGGSHSDEVYGLPSGGGGWTCSAAGGRRGPGSGAWLALVVAAGAFIRRRRSSEKTGGAQ